MSLIRKKFPDHASRIEYIIVDDLKSNPVSAWENEFHQRNALARSLFEGVDGSLPDDHWILLSDVDEIPRPEAIQRFQPRRYISALLAQKHYCYTFNNMVASEGASFPWWRRVRITTVAQLRNWFGSLQSLRDYRDKEAELYHEALSRYDDQCHLQVYRHPLRAQNCVQLSHNLTGLRLQD